tara:strand:- start:71 stop:526 length:456 start_codon:yes stop_codon:yes gene_type:complete
MALVEGTGYNDVYWTNVLKKIQEIIVAEFTYGKVYIAPEITTHDPFSIKIWGPGATTEELFNDAWHKVYSVSVCMYMIEKNRSEAFYKKFYSDTERLYQLLFNNITVSGTLGWYNGVANDIVYNELEANEEDIDGINKAEIDFTCIVNRVN